MNSKRTADKRVRPDPQHPIRSAIAIIRQNQATFRPLILALIAISVAATLGRSILMDLLPEPISALTGGIRLAVLLAPLSVAGIVLTAYLLEAFYDRVTEVRNERSSRSLGEWTHTVFSVMVAGSLSGFIMAGPTMLRRSMMESAAQRLSHPLFEWTYRFPPLGVLVGYLVTFGPFISLYLGFRWIYASHEVIMLRKGPIAALRGSWRLSWGRMMATAKAIILPSLPFCAVLYAVSIPVIMKRQEALRSLPLEEAAILRKQPYFSAPADMALSMTFALYGLALGVIVFGALTLLWHVGNTERESTASPN